jgi:hypothetical protein
VNHPSPPTVTAVPRPGADAPPLEQLLGMMWAIDTPQHHALVDYYREHRHDADTDGNVPGHRGSLIYGRARWIPAWEVYAIGRTTDVTVTVRPFSAWIVTLPDPAGTLYENCWHYSGLYDAYMAARTWLLEGDAEPTGWHSHPQSGRRRPTGDPGREFNVTVDVGKWLRDRRPS